MTLSRSWQFVGGTGGLSYRFYDWLRRRLNERLVRCLASQLPPREPGQRGNGPTYVLEAGSGTAFATSLFRRRGGVDVAVCLDIDEAALKEAKRRDPDMHAVVGDMRHLPFRDGAYSLVFNSSTVEHLDDRPIAVGEMRRVCRATGRVFVGVPYSFGPLWFQPLVRRTLLGDWLGQVFSRRRLHELLSSAGLQPVASFRYFLRFFIGVVAAKTGAGTPPASGGPRR